MSRTRKAVAALCAAVIVVGGLSCGENHPVHLAAVLPLTGSYALYGVPIRRGIDLAYEQTQANEELGFAVELTVTDSESQADKAAELLKEAYHHGAVAAIGGVTTAEALAMVPVSDEADKVLLSPSASTPRLTGISRNFFRIFPSDFREGNKMGNFAAQILGVDKVVILAAESPYARGVQDVFKSEFERYGGEVTEVIEYPPGGTDFSGLIDRALQLRPVAIYVADYAQNTSKIIHELRQKNFDGKILTTSAYASPDVIGEAGKDAEGVLLTQTAVQPDDPGVKAFMDAYKAKYGSAPDIWAAHGYDAFMVLVEAIEEGGHSPNDLWKGMRSIRNFRGPSGIIQFDEKGDVSKFPRVYMVDDGELVDYDKAVETKRQEILKRIEDLNRARARSQAGNAG